MVKWNQGSMGAPKNRRLLLVVTAGTGKHACLGIVVGHWHEAREEFVLAELPNPRVGFRPEVEIESWAEIPDLPEGADLAMLSDDDLWA
jgi:hypothetical protein